MRSGLGQEPVLPTATLPRSTAPRADTAGEYGGVPLSVVGADLLFVSPGWAHDLGNSLQAGALHAEVLKLTLGDVAWDQRARAVTALQEQLERLHQLVSAWVELTVPGMSGDLPFDLRDLLRDLELIVAVTLRHRGLTLEISSSVAELPINGDRFALLHACLCLVSHVVETTTRGGCLKIGTELTGHRTLRCSIALMSVNDTVDPTSTASPAAAFGDPSADRSSLGLSFAKRTLEQHRGRLEGRHIAPAGREFRFELPLHSGSEATEASEGA